MYASCSLGAQIYASHTWYGCIHAHEVERGGILLFGCWWGYSPARGRGSGGGISVSLVPLNAFLEA